MDKTAIDNEDKSMSLRERAQLDCWLSEYNTLRDEILIKLNNQRYAIFFNITSIGAIFSVLFTINQYPPIILLSIPFISTAFGLFFLNQSFNMVTIAQYISNVIKPNLSRLTKNNELLNWENYVRNTKFLSKRELTYHIAIVLIFICPSIFSLIANYEFSFPITSLGLNIVWWSGLSLTLILTFIFISRFLFWKINNSQRK